MKGDLEQRWMSEVEAVEYERGFDQVVPGLAMIGSARRRSEELLRIGTERTGKCLLRSGHAAHRLNRGLGGSGYLTQRQRR